MYYFFFKNLFNPFFEKIIKKRKILDYRNDLEKSQWWSQEDLFNYQSQSLKELLLHAQNEVPYWQGVFQEKKISFDEKDSPEETRSKFFQLPITEKSDIRKNKEKMIANNYRGKTWTKATGGSTGVPLELDYNKGSYEWRVAVSQRGYGWAGCEDGIKQAYIWGIALGDIGWKQKLKERIHQFLLRRFYFNCFSFTEKNMAVCLNKINAYKPKVIIGYTNPLYNFALFVEKNGGLKFRPESIITAAEKVHPFQRDKIEKVFHCDVYNTYGSREFMLMASECPKHTGLHVNIENFVVEIVQPDGSPTPTGEMGELVVTDLHNYGMPFVRYKIGDLAIASSEKCSCGRNLPLLKDVVGRSLDMILTPDGRFVPGEFFPHLLKDVRDIEKFQVLQKTMDKITIKMVCNENYSEEDQKFLETEIEKVMGKEIEIEFQLVDDIPLTKTGKHRVTVSELKL